MSVPIRRAFGAGALIVLLSGCSLLGVPAEAPRDESGTVVGSANASADTLKVGDCLDDPGETEFDSYQALPCADPHHYEAFSSTTMTTAELPAEDDTEAWDREVETCYTGAFQRFVGTGYENSTLEVVPLIPTKGSWEMGDRTITCLVGKPGLEPTTGSLKGTRL